MTARRRRRLRRSYTKLRRFLARISRSLARGYLRRDMDRASALAPDGSIYITNRMISALVCERQRLIGALDLRDCKHHLGGGVARRLYEDQLDACVNDYGKRDR